MTEALPPRERSAAAAGLTAAAKAKKFSLQVCTMCQSVQYPPRDVCWNCLNDQLPWLEVNNLATVIAISTLYHSNEEYFQNKVPWRIGTVKLDCGPVAIANLRPEVEHGQRVLLALELNAACVAVLTAYPLIDDSQST